MKKLQLKEVNVYGNILIYPMCQDSKLFAKLLNKKTFSNNDINTIKELGYTIEILPLN